jgi:hypothetical protein
MSNKCPVCEAEIEQLDYVCQEYDYGTYSGDQDWNSKGPGEIVPNTMEFFCPFCEHIISKSIDGADKFLKGEENGMR